MVVVLGEVFGELVASVIVGGHDPMDHADAFEDQEVPVSRARGEIAGALLHFRDGEGPRCAREHVDQRGPARGEALTGVLEPGRDGIVQLAPGALPNHGRTLAMRGTVAGVDLDAAARFRSLVAAVDNDPPLDEGALLIAATATGADVELGLARLDDLAAAALAFEDSRTPAGLARVLFVDWAFAGNTADYDDPRNSFLPDVIDRRLGLPIALSVLMIEVGRRIGVGLHGVGMPGHFLVGVDADPDEFIDPFHAGAALDRTGCRARFMAMYGSQAQFGEQYLEPTSSRLILLRMVTNLQHAYARRRSPNARWAAGLRLAFPEIPPEERERTADVLASVGATADAAAVLDELAAHGSGSDRDRWARQATAYRSQSN